MKSLKWVALKYDEMNFGDRFQISEEGYIKNKIKDTISYGKWEHNKYYVILYYNKKTYRIKVGKAQVDSGLKQTIFDRHTRVTRESLISQELRDELKILVREVIEEDFR